VSEKSADPNRALTILCDSQKPQPYGWRPVRHGANRRDASRQPEAAVLFGVEPPEPKFK
jgi:hypothetical protein